MATTTSDAELINGFVQMLGFKSLEDAIGNVIDKRRIDVLVAEYKRIGYKTRLKDVIARHMRHRLENDRECDILFLLKHLLYRNGYEWRHGRVGEEHIYNIIKMSGETKNKTTGGVDIQISQEDIKDLMESFGFKSLEQADGKIFNKAMLKNFRTIEEYEKRKLPERFGKYGLKVGFKSQNKEQEMIHILDKILDNIGYEVKSIWRTRNETDYFIRKKL